MFTQKAYKLNRHDVEKVLVQENVSKYRNFVFSGYQAIAVNFWSCLFGTFTRKRQKFLILYKDGVNRIESALDVKKIIKV